MNEIYDLDSLYALGETCPSGYHAGFAFSLITFGLCSPITVRNVDNVMMSSTFPIRQYGDPDYPFQNYKPHHLVDKHLGWANIETYDVESEYNRPEKIENIIKPHFDENGPSVIRVCGHQSFLKDRKDKSTLNCGICDKCGRAIATLSNYGIDPSACGFDVHELTFKIIKNNIIYKRYHQQRERYFWGELKKHLKEPTIDFHGSTSFLDWLGGYNL